MDLTLVRAQGAALALIGVLLEREGVVAHGEFSRMLGLLAVAASETDVDEGEVLAVWAALTSDAHPGSPSDAASFNAT